MMLLSGGSPLAIYLNDHLAAATGARELVRRSAAANRSTTYGPELERLAREIDEDRATLLAIMDVLGVGVDRLKVAAGWGVEKLGRLKLNGRLYGYSPLSRVLELETLILGVRGKLALWRTLAHLAPPALARFDLSDLCARADSQLSRLESARVAAITAAFA